MNSSGSCQCKSATDPVKYYRNSYTNECFKCPAGCICNSSGCQHCVTNSQRYQFVDDTLYSNVGQCPCMQTTLLINNTCTYCEPLKTYYYNGDCVECYECNQCDWSGRCTSCKENMTLVEGTCICTNSTFIKINGVCACPTMTYLSPTDHSCQPCPVECEDCKLGSGRFPIVNCLTCRQGMHRQDYAAYNCPCDPGYGDSMTQRHPFCCKLSCGNCNQTGCTSCLADLFRELDANQECVCMGTLIELNKTQLCGCLDGYYPYRLTCRACPLYCLTCAYNFTLEIVQCTSCPVDSNRVFSNITNGTNCFCEDYFVEASPPKSYCFPLYCVKPEYPCTACINGLKASLDGKQCLCNGSFLFGSIVKCEKCELPGCKQCYLGTFCGKCNDNFYLTEMSCKKNLEDNKFLVI